MSTKLIIGLGNVGSKYSGTRHNIGFMVADELARQLDAPFKVESKFKAAIAQGVINATKVIIAKPATMMNLSGQAVGAIAKYYDVTPEDVWVVYDEADLLFGVLRTRHGGSSAGHNGIKSVSQHIGEDYWRFRLGIRNTRLDDTPTDQFVLDNFTKDEAAQLPNIVGKTADLLIQYLEAGKPTDTSMNLT